MQSEATALAAEVDALVNPSTGNAEQ